MCSQGRSPAMLPGETPGVLPGEVSKHTGAGTHLHEMQQVMWHVTKARLLSYTFSQCREDVHNLARLLSWWKKVYLANSGLSRRSSEPGVVGTVSIPGHLPWGHTWRPPLGAHLGTSPGSTAGDLPGSTAGASPGSTLRATRTLSKFDLEGDLDWKWQKMRNLRQWPGHTHGKDTALTYPSFAQSMLISDPHSQWFQPLRHQRLQYDGWV